MEICFWNDWQGLARKRVRVRKEASTTTFHYEEYDTEEAEEKETLLKLMEKISDHMKGERKC